MHVEAMLLCFKLCLVSAEGWWAHASMAATFANSILESPSDCPSANSTENKRVDRAFPRIIYVFTSLFVKS